MVEPKKRGRPPKAVAERRRHNQTFRCNDEMLARLQAAADSSQRSISEEVEKRIEASFDDAEKLQKTMKIVVEHYLKDSRKLMEDLAGGSVPLAIGLIFGNAYLDIHYAANRIYGDEPEWYDNKEKFDFILEYFTKRAEWQISQLAQMDKDLGSGSSVGPRIWSGEGERMQFSRANRPDSSLLHSEGPLTIVDGLAVRHVHNSG